MADKETEAKDEAMKEIERLAEEQTKQEAAESRKEKEIKVKSKKEAEAAEKKAKEAAEKLAKEQAKKAKKEAEEAKKAKKEADKLAKEQAKKAKKKVEKGKPEPSKDAGLATYEGNFQLVLPLTVGFKQVQQITEQLAGIEGVKVVWTGGSVDEGTFIAISVTKEMPLASVISKMPMVEGVEVKGDKIAVTVKGAA